MWLGMACGIIDPRVAIVRIKVAVNVRLHCGYVAVAITVRVRVGVRVRVRVGHKVRAGVGVSGILGLGLEFLRSELRRGTHLRLGLGLG